MKTERRKRMVRPRTTYGWQEVPADLAILTFLARYRFLRGTTIYALMGTQGYGHEATKKRLRILFDNYYVDKLSNQPGAKPNYNASDVYQIGKLGLERLQDHPPATTNLRYIELTKPVTDFRHTMMICDTLSSIEIGVAQTDCTFISQGEILDRLKHRPESLALPYRIQWTWEGRTEKRESKIIPDGIFGIQYPDGKSRLYLLEAEHWSPTSRTTLKSSSTFRKVLAYQAIKQAKTKVYGKSNFHVLFVFPTDKRTYNARDMIRETFGEQPMFLLQHQPVTEEVLATIKPNPELFTGVWLRPGLPDGSISIPI